MSLKFGEDHPFQGLGLAGGWVGLGVEVWRGPSILGVWFWLEDGLGWGLKFGEDHPF